MSQDDAYLQMTGLRSGHGFGLAVDPVVVEIEDFPIFHIRLWAEIDGVALPVTAVVPSDKDPGLEIIAELLANTHADELVLHHRENGRTVHYQLTDEDLT